MKNKPSECWSQRRWDQVERETRLLALEAATEEAAWAVIVKRARMVLRAYSTSFFIVTRFLPPVKRAKVEAIYAAVRYPDEIVDTFRVDKPERMRMLDQWAARYEESLNVRSIKEALEKNIPCFLASFSAVVRDQSIPHEHYRSFIEAMRLDVHPRRFDTLDDLIESYIYGSAIVVGYFLTYVYGASVDSAFNRALGSATALGVGLQLTNFLRDVGEDQRRGRLYLPLDMLRAEGIEEVDLRDRSQHAALARVLQRLSAIAEQHYASALADLDAFAADSRTAIRACVDVYRQLNNRIGRSTQGVLHRESVPMTEKLKALPTSKYWRLPLAYLFTGR
ncbi:MAG TPA: phytoene/squalene synthase family protein [Blastocatellia bacterium]|jgi:phytoene synthase|nr:phytoene/squalene synthase family protein [Blastocatellia bacterium]